MWKSRSVIQFYPILNILTLLFQKKNININRIYLDFKPFGSTEHSLEHMVDLCVVYFSGWANIWMREPENDCIRENH